MESSAKDRPVLDGLDVPLHLVGDLAQSEVVHKMRNLLRGVGLVRLYGIVAVSHHQRVVLFLRRRSLLVAEKERLYRKYFLF